MRTSSLHRAVPVAAMAILIGLGCEKTVPPPSSGPSVPLGFIPKCPAHPFEFHVVEQDTSKHGWVPKTLTTIGLAGDRTSVVEVHDCQRLIVATTGGAGAAPALEYGPLAVIFASDSLPTVFGPDGSSETPQRAAAVIYSWGQDDPRTGDYPSLGITGGWNCLYLSRAGTRVEARMVPAITSDDCQLPPSSAGTALEVIARPLSAGMLAEDIPEVARWGWASTKDGPTNDIWVRCGDLACEIGPRDFKPERALPDEIKAGVLALTGDSKEARRVLEFSGYYDHQLLAEVEGSGVRVGSLASTLIPWPNLARLNNVSNFGAWTPVAVAYLPEASTGYQEKLNFEEGLNLISMRRGALLAGEALARPCTVSDGGDPWFAMIKSPSGATKILCMHRYTHTLPPNRMPGTVRWQWLDDDEKTWIRCPQGCCPIT